MTVFLQAAFLYLLFWHLVLLFVISFIECKFSFYFNIKNMFHFSKWSILARTIYIVPMIVISILGIVAYI